MRDLVSIIIPVYNSEKYLRATIDSVLSQTYENWELILIDDNSSDSSPAIIEEYNKKESRIKSIYMTENKGAGVTRNIGLKSSIGDYIAFLDSDDIWHSNKLTVQLDLMKTKNLDVVCSWYYNVDEKGEILSYFITPKKISYSRLKFNNYILTSSLICSKHALKGLRFSEIRKRQDWIFFLDILKRGKAAHSIDECLVSYRKSKNSLSANKISLIKSNLSVISNYFYFGNKLKSIFHFGVFLVFYFYNKIFNIRR